MKRIALLLGLVLCTLSVFSQTCEELDAEYLRLNALYKTSRTTYQKKACIRQMELIIRRGKEANCGFPQHWAKELRERKQSLYPSALFENKEYVFDAARQEVVIGVKLSGNIKLISYPSWMEFAGNEGTTGFIFLLQENLSVYERNGVVEVEKDGKTHQCPVTQEAAPLQANVTEHIGFGMDGGEGIVYVETNDSAWVISGGANWISTENTNEGIKVICASNSDKKSRTAKVKVKFACGASRMVEIAQLSAKPVFSIPQPSISFNNEGGKSNNVVVRCNYGQWHATPSENWIHVKRKYGGISIECEPNSLASRRTAVIRIETDGVEHVVENITIVQQEAAPFLYADQSKYSRDGKEEELYIPVKTNISDWKFLVVEGASWAAVSKSENGINVNLSRNDQYAPRTAEIRLYGNDQSYTLAVTQPNRGFAGRYNDYFDAHGGPWRLTWFSIDVHGLTTLGNRLSFVNARWKSAELSLVGFTVDYFMEGMVGVSWEPIARGYMPITRDGKWAAYLGMGAHISMTGGYNYFLLEVGAEVQWNEKFSSHIFFKYNGECSFGMSFDIGKWYNFKK